MERILSHFGEHIAGVDLLPVGTHRRNRLQPLVSDGYVIVRHPDLQTTREVADLAGTDLQLDAGCQRRHLIKEAHRALPLNNQEWRAVIIAMKSDIEHHQDTISTAVEAAESNEHGRSLA